MESKDLNSTKRIDVLDGIRAVSVIIVLIFHFWQQTWIFPTIKTPFLSFLGITKIDFTPFAKAGYLFVDMMVLLSGFLLCLPLARCILLGEPMDKWSRYFKKRAVRILPSYLLCIVLLFVYELVMGGYGAPVNWGAALSDLILHLTFMQTWTVTSYLSTKLNVVLWTVAIEVWFYLLFPVIAAFIRPRKKELKPWPSIIRAIVTALIMIGVSYAYIYLYVLNTGSAFSNSIDSALRSVGAGIRSNYLSMVINQLPAFMGCYAVGLFGAFIYVLAAKHLKQKWWTRLISTLIAIGFALLIVMMVNDCASLEAEAAQKWQMTERLKLALVYMGFILFSAYAIKPYRFIFSNKLMVFLSTISYNLYIWHQWLCVKIKYDWRIPFWEGDKPPNQAWTPEATVWKTKYAVIITVAAFAAAIIMTYLWERPAADLLNGRKTIYNGKLKELKERRKAR